MKVLEQFLLNRGIFLSGWDCLFADGMPREFNPTFHCSPGFAFPREVPWLQAPRWKDRTLSSSRFHPTSPFAPTTTPYPSASPGARVSDGSQFLHLQIGGNPPPIRGFCLGLKAESILGPSFRTHPSKKKKNHKPGHILLNCGKRELDFIQEVYKIQKADNSLTVSQKNK